MTLLDLKNELIAKLKQSPEAEANLILFHLFRESHTELKNFSDVFALNPKLSEEKIREARHLASERSKGIPLQHLLGYQFFFNHEYIVNESVLAPRPETEILIDAVFNWLERMITQKNIPENFKFAELGLGTGILSCEILARFKKATGLGSEVSPDAISIAHGNLLNVVGQEWNSRFQILEPENTSIGFELFQTQGPFDLILSNPPYVSVEDEISDEVLNHEPHLALFPTLEGDEENPDHFYDNFILHGKKLMNPKGAAFFEIPHERASLIQEKFKNAGFSEVFLIEDLTTRPRVLFVQN